MSPWKWQDHAACRGKDLNLFFGHEGERYDQDGKERREAEARAVCASCPVSRQCHITAMDGREYGLWAGLDEEQRANQRRKDQRAALTAARRQERVAS